MLRSFFKVCGVLLLVAVLLYGSAAAYVLAYLQPPALQAAITTWAKTRLGRTLTLKEARIDASGTVHLVDVCLQNPTGGPQLTIKAVTVGPTTFALPFIELTAPRLTVVRRADGSTDLDDVVAKLTDAPPPLLPLLRPVVNATDWALAVTGAPELSGERFIAVPSSGRIPLQVFGKLQTAHFQLIGSLDPATRLLAVDALDLKAPGLVAQCNRAAAGWGPAGPFLWAPKVTVNGRDARIQLVTGRGNTSHLSIADLPLAGLPWVLKRAEFEYHEGTLVSKQFEVAALGARPPAAPVRIGNRATVTYSGGRLTIADLELEAFGVAVRAAAAARIETGTVSIESLSAHWKSSQLVVMGHPALPSLAGLKLSGTVDPSDLPQLGGLTLEGTLGGTLDAPTADIQSSLLGGQLTASTLLKDNHLDGITLKLDGASLERVLSALSLEANASGTVHLTFKTEGASPLGKGQLTLPDLVIAIGRHRAEATASRMFRRAHVNGGLLSDVIGNDTLKEAGLAHAKETGYYDRLIDEIARPHKLGPITASVTAAPDRVRFETVKSHHLQGYLEVEPRTRRISGVISSLRLGSVGIGNLTISGTLDSPVTHADINQLTMDGRSVVATIRESAMNAGTAVKLGEQLLRKNGGRIEEEVEKRIGPGAGKRIRSDIRQMGDFLLDKIMR